MTEKSTVALIKGDSYQNTFGSGMDAGTACWFEGQPETMYRDDSLAKKIIDVIPEEMVTPGFTIEGIEDDAEFKSRWDGMKLNERIIAGLAWGRLFGGGMLVAVVNDNRKLSSPVREGAELEGLRVYDKTKIQIEQKETDPRKPTYGQAVIYRISPGNSMPEYLVHASRCYVIDGERVTDAQRIINLGWGASVLNKSLIDAILDYNECERLATELLRRKQQAVWKAKGLADLCDDNEGLYAARLRLAQVDDNAGVGRAIGIDATDEEYEILNSDISGVDIFLDKKMDRIVNYSGIHEIILKNKNVGGVSASQNTALETFYKLVNRKRNEDYRPLLEWLLPFIVKETEWSIVFEPLSVPSAKDESETMSKNVESIGSAFDRQMIDIDESRDSLRALGGIFKLKDGAPNIVTPEGEDIDPGAEPENTTPAKANNNEGNQDA